MPKWMYILPAPVWEESSTERTQRTRRLGERGWREGVVRREAEQRFGPGGELWMLVEPGAAPSLSVTPTRWWISRNRRPTTSHTRPGGRRSVLHVRTGFLFVIL